MFLHVGQLNGYNYLNGSLSTTEIYKDKNTSCWPFRVHWTSIFLWRLLFTFWKCVLATQCYILKSGSTAMLMSVFTVLISVWTKTKSVCFPQTKHNHMCQACRETGSAHRCTRCLYSSAKITACLLNIELLRARLSGWLFDKRINRPKGMRDREQCRLTYWLGADSWNWLSG